MTFYEKVTEALRKQRDKHGLGENFVADEVNKLTNDELLQFISEDLGDNF